MAEIGEELEGKEGRGKKFLENLKKPENLATAIVLAASLTQPRQGGRNALQTLAQRGVGAFAFRGALERGVQQQRNEAEERDTERAFREGQIDVQRQSIQQRSDEATQNAQLQRDLQEDAQEFQASQNSLARSLQEAIASGEKKLTPDKALALLPAFTRDVMESLQYNEEFAALPPDKQVAVASGLAMKNIMKFGTALTSGLDFTIDSAGNVLVDDGLGEPAPPRTPGEPKSAPGEAPHVAPPAPPRRPPSSGIGRAVARTQEQAAIRQQVQREESFGETSLLLEDLRDQMTFSSSPQEVSDDVVLTLGAKSLDELRALGATDEEIRFVLQESRRREQESRRSYMDRTSAGRGRNR